MIDTNREYDSCKAYLYDLLGVSGTESQDKILYSKLYNYIQNVPQSPDIRIADKYLANAIRRGEDIDGLQRFSLEQQRVALMYEDLLEAKELLEYCLVIKDISLMTSDFAWLDLIICKYQDLAEIELQMEALEEREEEAAAAAAEFRARISCDDWDDEEEDEDEEDEEDSGFFGGGERAAISYFELNPWETAYTDSDGTTWDNPFYDDDY